jgi:U4/U6 small nuclear ribonucleoprotein PRP31
MAARIQDEIQALHKFIRDHYNKKFPELESLVQHPLDYARTVKRVGNQTVSIGLTEQICAISSMIARE